MEDSNAPNPIIKFLFVAILIGFFGGGFLLFVNLFVPFLNEAAFAIIGLCVGSILVVGIVVVKCVQVITGLRRLTPKLTEEEIESILDVPTDEEIESILDEPIQFNDS